MENKKDNVVQRMYERKKFFRLFFKNIDDDEYIRTLQLLENFKKPNYFTDIDKLNDYCEKHRYNANTYFTLATTDGNGGEKENLKYRYCLAWDFDKKLDPTLDAKEIMFRFKQLGLWYHAIVDSGHGFHVYMVIEKTNDLNKVEEVTKAIGEKLKADPDAMNQTQILRVPFSVNLKDTSAKKYVKIINMFDSSTIKPYNIDMLYKKYCSGKAGDTTDRTIKYALNRKQFPPCITSMLNGVNEGYRNFAILRLISFLKSYQFSKSESWNIIKEWNNKNSPPTNADELENQFEYIWNKEYNCFGCKTNDADIQAHISMLCDKEQCKNNNKNNIFIEGETITLEYKICEKLKPQKKSFQLKGNHLLLIGVFKNYPEGLNTVELIEKLSYKGKCCISNKTLGTVLKELADNGYLEKITGNKRNGQSDFYKLQKIDCREIDKFPISFFAVLGVIQKRISAEDFKVYCFIRFRLNKGLSVTQEKIGDQLGISQQGISKHINVLVKERYMEIVEVDCNSGSNIYRLNV